MINSYNIPHFMKEDVDKIYVVSDQYNKKWLSIKQYVNSIILGVTGMDSVAGILQFTKYSKIFSSTVITVPTLIVSTYELFKFPHTISIYIFVIII